MFGGFNRMKFMTRALVMVFAVAMLAACGGSGGSGGSDGSSSSGVSGAAVTGPILDAKVTLESVGGTLLATGVTSSSGAYSLSAVPSTDDYPVVMTVTAVDGSRFPNGTAFTGELKAMFANGDSTSNFHITSFSTLLYSVWDTMGRPTDAAGILSAKNQAVGLLQKLGVNVENAATLFATNPVSVSFEAKQQQLLFAAGVSDAAGAGEVLTKVTELGATVNDTDNDGLLTLVNNNTGLAISTAADMATALTSDIVQRQIIDRTTAALEDSGVSVVKETLENLVGADAIAAASRVDNAGSLVLRISGTPIAGPVLVANGASGGADHDIVVNTMGVEIDGDGVSDGTGITAAADEGVEVAKSSANFTLTVADTNVAKEYTVTFVYAGANNSSVTRSIVVKVLGEEETAVSAINTFTVPGLKFTSEEVTIAEGDIAVTTEDPAGSFSLTGADAGMVASLVLPSSMRLKKDGAFHQNYDVSVLIGGSSPKDIDFTGLSGYEIVANDDISNGEVVWTLNIWNAAKTGAPLKTKTARSIAYSSKAANKVRQITGVKFKRNSQPTARGSWTYGADSESATNIQWVEGDPNHVVFAASGNDYFEGNVQTWAMAAGDATDCSVLDTAITPRNDRGIIGSNKGFMPGNVDAASVTAQNYSSFADNACPGVFHLTAETQFAPTNVDVIRLNVDGVVSGSGVTFSHKE